MPIKNAGRGNALPKFNDEFLEQLLGAEDAENEKPERLKEYFFRNKAYDSLSSDLPIRIIVGHKGVGKSALLKMRYLEDLESGIVSLWIRPDDIKAIVTSSDGDLNSMIDKWKKGLLDLIFEKFVENIGRSHSDENNSLTRHTLNALFDAARNYIKENTSKVVDAAGQAIIASYAKNEKIRIYIDDLDRGWQARPSDIVSVSALLNAIRDLCGSDNRLQIRIGLRSDVYFLVRTSDESTDKIERHVTWLTWSNHEVLLLIAKRIRTFFGEPLDESSLLQQTQSQIATSLHKIVEPVFNGAGKWERAPIHRVLLSLTRRRPRDLIKLLFGGGKEAFRNNHELILTQDLRSTFAQYSNERMQDVINEFKTEMPNIGKLLIGMKPSKKEKQTIDGYLYSNDQLASKLRNLISSNAFSFTNGTLVSAKSLAEFLYKIDFITARRDDPNTSEIVRVYFDQNRFLQSQFGDFGFKWEVHPAYRWALQPEDIDSIFTKLSLSTD
jgi:hypothetical protein